MPVESGFAAYLFKLNCKDDSWKTQMFENYSLIVDNFPENAMIFVVTSIRTVHNQVPFAARMYIHNRDRVGKTIGPPPVFDVVRICQDFPDQFDWCIENTR